MPPLLKFQPSLIEQLLIENFEFLHKGEPLARVPGGTGSYADSAIQKAWMDYYSSRTAKISDNSLTAAPCPFCGREPQRTNRADSNTSTKHIWFIACFCGGYTANAHQFGATESEVLAKWNARHMLPRTRRPLLVAPSERAEPRDQVAMARAILSTWYELDAKDLNDDKETCRYCEVSRKFPLGASPVTPFPHTEDCVVSLALELRESQAALVDYED